MPDKPTRCFFMRRPPASAREMCEDFAPRNGAERASGERGANRAREKTTGLQPRNSRPEVRARKPKSGRRARTVVATGPSTPKSPARGSRPKTESGKTSANHGGRRASNSEILGPRFASENRKQRASGESSANRVGRRASNSEIPRPRVRARKPKMGSRARTVPAAGPPTLKLPARGSRPETENGESSANRVGRRASNLETPGPRFAPGNRNRGVEREPWRPPGLRRTPPHARRAHFAY